MAICHTGDNSHESLEFDNLSYESLEYSHLSCKCLGKRSIYHPSNCFGNNLPRSLLAHENPAPSELALFGIAGGCSTQNSVFFWYPDLWHFFTKNMHNLLSYCWHVRFHLQKYVELLTIDPHFPSSCFTAAQAAHFPGASTGLDSEVGVNGPRNCPFGEPSSDIGQLPPGKMGRLSSDHSFCSRCCHMASKRGLKGPSNKTA